jgi:hypothetical protein
MASATPLQEATTGRDMDSDSSCHGCGLSSKSALRYLPPPYVVELREDGAGENVTVRSPSCRRNNCFLGSDDSRLVFNIVFYYDNDPMQPGKPRRFFIGWERIVRTYDEKGLDSQFRSWAEKRLRGTPSGKTEEQALRHRYIEQRARSYVHTSLGRRLARYHFDVRFLLRPFAAAGYELHPAVVVVHRPQVIGRAGPHWEAQIEGVQRRRISRYSPSTSGTHSDLWQTVEYSAADAEHSDDAAE